MLTPTIRFKTLDQQIHEAAIVSDVQRWTQLCGDTVHPCRLVNRDGEGFAPAPGVDAQRLAMRTRIAPIVEHRAAPRAAKPDDEEPLGLRFGKKAAPTEPTAVRDARAAEERGKERFSKVMARVNDTPLSESPTPETAYQRVMRRVREAP